MELLELFTLNNERKRNRSLWTGFNTELHEYLSFFLFIQFKTGDWDPFILLSSSERDKISAHISKLVLSSYWQKSDQRRD